MPPPVKRSLEGILSALRQDVDSLLQRPPRSGSGGGADSVSWGNVLGKPLTFPPMIGPNADEAVAGNDPRLTNARPPTAHTHTSSQIADWATAVPAAVPAASETVVGKVELATTAEAIAGTDTTRVITAAGLAAALAGGASVPDASTTVKGKVQLATGTEVAAGTDALKAVTPAGVEAAMGARRTAGEFNLPGMVQMFAGASPVSPQGWILCDGRAVSRTVYAALFAAIGTAYGAGDGSTTFNVPNLKGRIPVGQDAAQSEFNTLGKAGGAKTHVLSVDEMPVHSHPQYVTANNGSEAIRRDYTNDGGSARFPQGTNTGNAGGGQAHNNLQPYVVLNYIIKT